MHGRRQDVEDAKTAEERMDEVKKFRKYLQFNSMMLKKRKAGEAAPDEDAMGLSAVILKKNPDHYTMWNWRREVFLRKLREGVPVADLAGPELALSQEALAKANPKSYCAWFHRRWLVSHDCVDLSAELALCERMLDLDERNFHCWSYRRFIAEKLGRTPDEELAAAGARVDRNFSNYSAWHQRARTLPTGTTPLAEAIPVEIETAQQAVFTEPDDQSAWMYARWLASGALAAARAQAQAGGEWEAVVAATWGALEETCRELLEVEPDSKWARVVLAFVLDKRASGHVNGSHRVPPNMSVGIRDELRTLYDWLETHDAAHRGFYAFKRRALTPAAA